MRSYLAQHPFLHRDYSRERYYSDPLREVEAEIKLRKHQNKNKPCRIDAVFLFDLSNVVKLGKFSPLDVKRRSFKHEFET